MKKVLLIFILLFTLLNAEDSEEKSFFTPNYSFIDTSINYLDWTQGTQNSTFQKSFAYLELEGGAGWDWGSFYGFMDIENPLSSYDDSAPDDLRFTFKPVLDIDIKNNFNLHVQTFYLESKSFYVNNFVTGISYKYFSDYGLWFIPYIGVHYQNSTYYSGFNGYMAGWSFNYDFKLFNQDFYIFNWNEIEFDRAKEGYELDDGTPIGDGKSYGVNGALSLWYKATQGLTLGLQYRYAKYKLGSAEYQSAMIYSLKYYY